MIARTGSPRTKAKPALKSLLMFMSGAGDNVPGTQLDIAIEEWVVEIVRPLGGRIMQDHRRLARRRFFPGRGAPKISNVLRYRAGGAGHGWRFLNSLTIGAVPSPTGRTGISSGAMEHNGVAGIVVRATLQENALLNMMNAWIEAARFGADTQHVMMLRLMRLASGGPLAATEAGRMVSEKIAAFGEAQNVILTALATGSSLEAAAVRVYVPYRRRVRANSRRLGA